MRKTLLATLFLVIANAFAFGEEVKYDFLSSIPAGWTSTATPNGFETTGYSRGCQFLTSTTLTLNGVSNVTKVEIVCSANTDKNSMALSVGGTEWANESLPKENDMIKTYTGAEASGSLIINITRAEKSVYIKSITVTGNVEGGNSGEGGGNDDDKPSTLNPDYVYEEPTIITVSDARGNNTPYSFIQKNIEVKTTAGAQTDSYFGCNAGHSITFTATQPIKGIVINGYVKQDFEASVSAGDIMYVDASEGEVTNDPVVVITDINNKTVTITCVKQMRCYNVEFYFKENPEVEISGDELTYEWEPDKAENFNITFDDAYYTDWGEFVGFPYVNIYFVSEDYEMDVDVLAPYVNGTVLAPGTYEINFTEEDGTVIASVGADNDYGDYPTCLYTNFIQIEEDSWLYDPYYIVSGTLTVAEDPAGVKMTINAKSYKGSTINATFTGKAKSLYEDEEDVDGIKEINTDYNLVVRKVLNNNRIEIIKHGKRFTTGGLKI